MKSSKNYTDTMQLMKLYISYANIGGFRPEKWEGPVSAGQPERPTGEN